MDLVTDTQLTRLRVTLPDDGSWVLDAETRRRRVCVRRVGTSQIEESLSLRLGSAKADLALP